MKKVVDFILFSVLLGCVKEIDIDYPDGSDKLTLNCVINPGETIRATLTTTLPFEEVQSSPSYKDALITLYENGELVDTLTVCEAIYRESQNDTAYTYCSNYNATTGNTYLVQAKKQGYPIVHGRTTIPKQSKVLKIESYEDENGNPPYEVTMEDAKGEENYYILYFFYESSFETQVAEITTADPTVNIYGYIGILQLPTDEKSGSQAYFTDEYFVDGVRKLTFRMYISSGAEPNGLVVSSVSKEYYDYLKNIEINRATQENPFSQALQVPSNVENGFGLVGSRHNLSIRF